MMRRSSLAALAVFAASLAAGGGSFAAGLKIELPPQQTALAPGSGSELAKGRCLICHSSDYIATQPPGKPLAFWKAEVEKMRKVYGAQVADDEVAPLADYLTHAYGSGQ